MVQEIPHSNKKTILFALASSGILILLLAVTYLIVNSGSDSSQIPVDELKTYKNDQFSINYPNEWQVETINAGGESGVSIKPLVSVSNNPAMLILISSSSSNPTLGQRQQVYMGFGFKKDVTQIDNLEATRIRGTIPPKSAADDQAIEILQATHIFLDKGESSYLLKYTYMGSSLDPTLEDTFQRILSSFKFN